jgi:hypothetical protein
MMSPPAERGGDGPRALSFAERVTLFVCVMRREHATRLLDCFADRPRARALAFAKQVREWESSTRQARVSRELGVRHDGVQRLHQLIVEAPPLLRSAIAEQLSANQRWAFPHLTPSGPVAPAMRALAKRLVREAT